MRHFIILLLLSAFFGAAVQPANAQLPRIFSYQGIVVDQALHPISDGMHSVTIKIYDMNGTALYSENQTAVLFTKGIFSVAVGSVAPIPSTLAFDKEYMLGVSIDGGTEMSPRTPILSAPYALTAGSLVSGAANVVNSVNGQSGAVTLQAGTGTTISNNGSTITINSTVTGGTGIQGIQNIDGSLKVDNSMGPTATVSVATGGITTAKIADGAVTAAKITSQTTTAGMVLAANGTGGVVWQLGGGMNLPFSGTVTSTPASAFSVTNLGAGTAGAGTFTVSNSNSNAWALSGTSNGTAQSIGSYGVNTGLGRGGYFEIINPLNASTGLTGKTQGLGDAVDVMISNNLNPSSALQVTTNGTGKAGLFQITNVADQSDGIDISTVGTGNGVAATAVSGNAVYGNASSVTAANYGVVGEATSPNGAGIKASYVGANTGTALVLNNGPIKVAGVNKAAFKWVATAANIVNNYTIISNPLTDNDPNAILFVTPVLDVNNVFINMAPGVLYIGNKWAIFLENVGVAMPVNAAFNVIVFKQ